MNISQLVASSLNITNDDFANALNSTHDDFNKFKFNASSGNEMGIVNDGSIYADVGVALIGQKILNRGTVSTGDGGFVVMTAGDKVTLGQPGSNILVEMNSSTSTIPDAGTVVNERIDNDRPGMIESPGGQIVLAAGDLFSAAMTPEDRTAKVLFGDGIVEQKGTIDASASMTSLEGKGGIVNMTSGDRTTLYSGSITKANAYDTGDSGLVSVHSQGISELLATAEIEAKGGYTPTELETDTGNFKVLVVKENSVEIIGDDVEVLGSIDATPSGLIKKGKIYIEADDLKIVDELPTTNTTNLIVEEFIEDHSDNGVDVELAAHSKSNGTITA